ncbi:MAG: hypothetical protein V1859_05210 [archaeon]
MISLLRKYGREIIINNLSIQILSEEDLRDCSTIRFSQENGYSLARSD